MFEISKSTQFSSLAIRLRLVDTSLTRVRKEVEVTCTHSTRPEYVTDIFRESVFQFSFLIHTFRTYAVEVRNKTIEWTYQDLEIKEFDNI